MLTEKEKMQRAKLYMLKLADGINPIDDSKLEDDTILSNERLSRCFLYVAEVLDNVIASKDSGKSVSKNRKKEFTITLQQLQDVTVLKDNIPISKLTNEINKTINNPDMKKLQPKIINDWLVKQGYLKDIIDSLGHIRRELTAKSADIGITSKQEMGTFGEYTIILYSETAQRFIIDNMFEILDSKNEKENS